MRPQALASIQKGSSMSGKRSLIMDTRPRIEMKSASQLCIAGMGLKKVSIKETFHLQIQVHARLFTAENVLLTPRIIHRLPRDPILERTSVCVAERYVDVPLETAILVHEIVPSAAPLTEWPGSHISLCQ
jgi:hypothetical protein